MAARKTKILIGSVVRQDPSVLKAHVTSLLWQDIPDGTEIEYAFVLDGEVDKEILPPGSTLLDTDPRPADAQYVVGEKTHIWAVSTFEHLAKQKQKLLNLAQEKHFDYVWLVDTDLILDRTTLRSLLFCNRVITSAVFWTEWTNGEPGSIGPNIWMRHPYGMEGKGRSMHEVYQSLIDRQKVEVAGGGACILIQRRALERNIVYHPRFPGLPSDNMWQGEDRSFSIRAEQAHVLQWADAWPDIFHAYHPSDRTPEVLDYALRILGHERQQRVSYGDLVNFVLEPIEEPALEGQSFNLRGRLGSFRLLPEIEQAILETKVGEERFLSLHFPPWWPKVRLPTLQLDYAGKEKVVRFWLVDAKPFSYAPVIGDHILAGAKENALEPEN